MHPEWPRYFAAALGGSAAFSHPDHEPHDTSTVARVAAEMADAACAEHDQRAEPPATPAPAPAEWTTFVELRPGAVFGVDDDPFRGVKLDDGRIVDLRDGEIMSQMSIGRHTRVRELHVTPARDVDTVAREIAEAIHDDIVDEALEVLGAERLNKACERWAAIIARRLGGGA